MKNEELKKASGYIKTHRLQKRWQKVVTCLAAVVVFCTTYALILPAITLEKEPCQIPEHTHSEACYAQTVSVTAAEPVCSIEKLDIHQHTADCYDENGNPVCGYSDFVVHEHDGSCYDEEGNLWCPLPEIKTHTHDGSCYAAAEPAHTHTENCYIQERGELVCTEEAADHQHTDDCYAWEQVLDCDLTETVEEPELVCGKTEIILHKHSSDCFDENGSLVCGKQQVLEHIHNADCFQTVEEAADAKTLTCGLEEHTHRSECNLPVELTEEEQAQVEEVITLIDALPTQEEMDETLAAFEDAGDEDGYDAYLTEIIAQAKAAYEAYSLLTEAQQEQVTGVEKLMALEPLWSMQTLADFPALTEDAAYVTSITVDSISDGTAPFDADDNAGNDSGTTNKIVRTFDTVTYNFTVTMGSYGSGTYSEARVKLEFVLPLTADQATFDQGAMAWMDQAEGYAPVLTTETRTIDGKETQCQVLTCYKQLLPSGDHPSVVPGTFGEMVVVNVKSMKNGDTFAPIFSACMEYGTWEGACSTHNQTEKATVVADKVTVSAAPKYNIRIYGTSSYKSTFDFSTGNSIAQAYGDGYGKGNVTGRVAKYGIVVQLYNDNASKGLKGIELPEGDITFDLKVASQYTVNDPNNTGYHQGDKIDTTTTYLPLLWSCDGNMWTNNGVANSDGRLLYDGSGSAYNLAPYNSGGGSNACYNGGTWTATQNGDTIHVTVSGYQINIDSMPTTQGDTTHGNDGYYGVDLGIGCFSAGELWLVQPYNKIGDTSDNQGPEFDVVKTYGEGKFDTSVQVINMKATTISGATLEDSVGTNNAQMKTNDDYASVGVELVLPGVLINRVSYANPKNWTQGVGVESYRDGLDFATPGTEIRLLGGFSYTHRNEPDNQLYWGTNLTKFYGSAIELTDTKPNQIYTGGAQPKEWMVYYATKPDGSDWKDDNELLTTYEDSLVFYKSPSEIPSGHLCVGLLFCFKEDTFSTSIGDPYFFIQQPAKVRDDMDLSGNTYIIASTSRVWTKSMFEQANMTLDEIPDWTNSETKLSSFPAGYITSGNTNNAGDTWYVKTDYSQAANGIVTDHNSDWRHWGDTLLVIGYKTGITKTLCQTSDNTAKTNYNLDAEQRVVDFKLQPRTYYDQVSGSNNLTTTVTIVDTLPKYLTYRPGSSYFGGTYAQTSANGGTQGTITGGTLREPDSVVTNADGTQTLTWVITGVTVGEDMPAIYYSANIGDRNNKDEDVPTGTTNLVNQVRITATHDIRQPTLANGNYAEVGIAVTRGSASSYGKYSKQNVVEADGQIDYVIYYDNNAVTEATKPVLVDAMPVSGVLNSNFNGTWKITSFQIRLVGADGKSLADLGALLHYTLDSQYAGKTLKDLQDDQVDLTTWTGTQIGTDGTVSDLIGKTPVMWVLNCESLPGNSELRVEYTIELIPEAGSTLDNIKYVNQFSTSSTTTTTETPVVRRTLEGLTWMDDNGDGIQDEADSSRISGVKVELLKLKDGGDAANESDYEPYCYPGTNTPIVIETGKQISVRASSASAATDYELGRYKFTDLPAGTFAVRFTDGDTTKISPLLASPSNRGMDDMKDSDGIATYTVNHATLEKTVILGIDMPTAESMSVTLYESKYHDSGFYEKSHELPNTGGPGTTPYTTGGLLLLTGAGVLLLYSNKKRRKEDFASS